MIIDFECKQNIESNVEDDLEIIMMKKKKFITLMMKK